MVKPRITWTRNYKKRSDYHQWGQKTRWTGYMRVNSENRVRDMELRSAWGGCNLLLVLTTYYTPYRHLHKLPSRLPHQKRVSVRQYRIRLSMNAKLDIDSPEDMEGMAYVTSQAIEQLYRHSRVYEVEDGACTLDDLVEIFEGPAEEQE